MTDDTWDAVRTFMRAVDRRTFDLNSRETIEHRFFGESSVSGEVRDIVDGAIDHVVDNNWEAASDLLQESFAEQSICAIERPSYELEAQRSERQFVGCHLYRP